MRSLEEVLHHRRWRRKIVRARVLNRRFGAAPRQNDEGATPEPQGETAADMRRRGQPLRPRVIWSNDGGGAVSPTGPGEEPQGPNGGPTAA